MHAVRQTQAFTAAFRVTLSAACITGVKLNVDGGMYKERFDVQEEK